MTSQPRKIDFLPRVVERPVEMQVLCLGLSRTATMSLFTALKKLGYNPYHCSVATSNKGHCAHWCESLNAKITGVGRVFGREEFDKLLGNYSAITDMPCVNHYAELLKAYPDAKVILTTRDPDKWVASFESSFYAILDSPLWTAVKYLLPAAMSFRQLILLALTDWTKGHPHDRAALRAAILPHNAEIRRIVPPEKLLEHTPKDGWEPLCRFLNKGIPNEPYPYVNIGGNPYRLWIIGLTIKFFIDYGFWIIGVVGIWSAWRFFR